MWYNLLAYCAFVCIKKMKAKKKKEKKGVETEWIV